ncbi:MAG: LPS assembly lipoprotein LptE [Myxococcaceae bacterium]
MRLAFAMALLVAVFGCGYRFTAGGAPLPEGTREVFAPVFVNRTSEPSVESTFTQSFREQLVRAGVLGGADSEARVEGEVLAIGGAANLLAPGGTGLASYRLSAVVRLRLTRGERVLADTQVSGSEDYPGGADPLQSEANRQAAVKRLAEQMMREGYSRLSTGW